MAIDERIQGANAIDAGRLSPYWGEHSARYIFALPYIENKTVLDIACGTGYGLGFMKEKAKRVVGVDVSIEAAKEAKNHCDEKTSVLLGDGLRLPFEDESYDVITSFETLEHIHERDKFLLELKRVMRNDGLLILSTQTRIIQNPSTAYHLILIIFLNTSPKNCAPNLKIILSWKSF
jgi:ubiquinone/menaquinone biosynthesis C-methylase UbiE